MIKITLLYSGILALMVFALSLNVIWYRFKEKTGLGHNQSPESRLFRSIRIHGNFLEYIPLLLLLMALDEMSGRSSFMLHTIGISLVLGRVLHYFGLTKSPNTSWQRFLGTNLTFIPLVIMGINLIMKGLQ